MIQRIQTVFLLLSAGSLASLFGLPMATSSETASGVFSDGMLTMMEDDVLMGLCLGALVFSVIAIFLFRSRTWQQILAVLVIICCIVLTAVAFLTTRSVEPFASMAIGLFMPLVAIAFAAVSIYHIRKDDKLVKSMDRLR